MKLWLKIAMVAAMTIAILVPLMMISSVIQERQRYRAQAVADIAAAVGQAQVLAGPVLVVPYSERVTRQVQDANGVLREVAERRDAQWHFFPKTLQAAGDLQPDIRRRGLHRVRVYDWKGAIEARFDVRIPDDGARVIGRPYLSWGIADVRGLRGTPVLEVAGRRMMPLQGSGVSVADLAETLPPEANERQRALAAANAAAGVDRRPAPGPGLHVLLEAPLPGQALAFDTRLAMTLAGTEDFAVLPLGYANHIRLRSPWPHPSFGGILPRHDIGARGFTAHWQVDALATNAQQRWRDGSWVGDARDLARVSLVEPVNAYAQADRATKYGVLFVVLTFAGFFMFELLRQVRVHPIQYGLVGLALALFFLLLLSLSEHIAFGWAYVTAAGACIGLIGFYLSAVLKSPARGLGFAAMLTALYAALYGLLLLEDNALVVGSGLLFAILAAVMLATRKVDWYALAARAYPTRGHASSNDADAQA